MSEPDHSAVLEFVQQHSAPFVTTADVAEQFPSVTGKTVRKRLNDLESAGRLSMRKVGAAAKVWYLPDQDSADDSLDSPESLSQ